MSEEVNELLNIFASMVSSNPMNSEEAFAKFSELSNKQTYPLNLLFIIMSNDIDISLRYSAALQLKNVVDKQWQRSSIFSDNDKNIIRNQVLSCAISLENKTSKLYIALSEVIAKISRSDWNQKWPNLFNILFQNDEWFIIYRVCQVQSTRRLSQGIVLFNELASVMSGQIFIKWQNFLSSFDSSDCTTLNYFNISYQLKTVNLFINNTHLITNEDFEFCNLVNNLALHICSYFVNVLQVYHNCLSILNSHNKKYFYKFLKSMVWMLLTYQRKTSRKILAKEIEHLGIITIFQSNNLLKSEKLTLLLMNLLLNTLNKEDKSNNKNTTFDFQIINLIRSKFLIKLDDDVEELINNPESNLEATQKEENIILYKIDDVVDEVLISIIKSSFRKNINNYMEMIQMGLNQINNMDFSHLESFLHLIGIVTQSAYYVDVSNSKKCASIFYCPNIVENVTNIILKQSKSPNSWGDFIIKRCIWILSKWAVDDPNMGSISVDRIITASELCFKISQSLDSILVKIEIILFIEHVIEGLDKMSVDFVITPILQDAFLNPSISFVVSLLDISSSSDTHTRLIEILIKLFNETNMWNNIDLVKNCANSIYMLWNGIKWPSKETLILRDRLLECLSTIVQACDPVIIQPILATLLIFINDSMKLMLKPGEKTSDNCSILLDNTLQLWHDIVYSCEVSIEGLDNIYSLVVFSDVFNTELDKHQTTLLLEIIQAYFLLKVIGSMNKDSFNSLTSCTWNYITKQKWEPKHEEDLCVMRIQLLDLWLLGFQQLSLGSPDYLFEINTYCQFLCDRTKELFTSTNEEPSRDQYVCIVNSTMTVLARICLFNRSMLKNLLLYLSNGNAEQNQQLVIGLLNRWLLRIDNQCSSIQQLFVLASIQWLPCCFETDPSILHNKLETIINSCIQICSGVPCENVEQNAQLAKAIQVPAERHLRLAYIMWNPLSNYTSKIKNLVSSFISGLNNSVGLENFQNLFNNLDPVVQSQFIKICNTSN